MNANVSSIASRVKERHNTQIENSWKSYITPQNALRLHNLLISGAVFMTYMRSSESEQLSAAEYLMDSAIHAAQAFIPANAPQWMKTMLATANLARMAQIGGVAQGKGTTISPIELNWVDAANHGMNVAALI